LDDPVGPKIFTSIHTTVLNKQFIMLSGTAVRRNGETFRTVKCLLSPKIALQV